MADKDGNTLEKDYHRETPFAQSSFPVKGASNLDWGMKDRLARIFNPKDGRTVMLAFDHGYIMGPTSGLERLDLVIPSPGSQRGLPDGHARRDPHLRAAHLQQGHRPALLGGQLGAG